MFYSEYAQKKRIWKHRTHVNNWWARCNFPTMDSYKYFTVGSTKASCIPILLFSASSQKKNYLKLVPVLALKKSRVKVYDDKKKIRLAFSKRQENFD
jgi:hypothetical protein